MTKREGGCGRLAERRMVTRGAGEWVRRGPAVVSWLLVILVVVECTPANEAALERVYQARDTLAAAADPVADAASCLRDLAWTPTAFSVTCGSEPAAAYDSLVQFPSPISSGDSVNDRVALEWYMPRDEQGAIRTAPAVLVVHESGRSMPVGRLFARSFQAAGMHSFLIHLPYYGKRNADGRDPPPDRLFTLIRQAIGDVRRGRDAIAVLPHVDTRHIAVQGTSLGGFVVATSASLDPAFQSVFIMLAGGNLYDMFQTGQREVAQARRELTQAGISDPQLKQLLWQIEPTRVAHRLDPQRTWLFSAEGDQVVPIANANALAKAARLPDRHHIRVPGNHYTVIVYFPVILQRVTDQIRASL
jgi:dienelactone hydrolase